jgi:hypothetical protein
MLLLLLLFLFLLTSPAPPLPLRLTFPDAVGAVATPARFVSLLLLLLLLLLTFSIFSVTVQTLVVERTDASSRRSKAAVVRLSLSLLLFQGFDPLQHLLNALLFVQSSSRSIRGMTIHSCISAARQKFLVVANRCNRRQRQRSASFYSIEFSITITNTNTKTYDIRNAPPARNKTIANGNHSISTKTIGSFSLSPATIDYAYYPVDTPASKLAAHCSHSTSSAKNSQKDARLVNNLHRSKIAMTHSFRTGKEQQKHVPVTRFSHKNPTNRCSLKKNIIKSVLPI